MASSTSPRSRGSDGGGAWQQLDAGAAAFKAYMCGSDPLLPGIDDARLLDAMRELAPGPAMIGLHAENDALLETGIARMQAQGRRDPLAHADSRPAIVEAEAVSRAILFGAEAGAHVHIVHLSTAAALEHVLLPIRAQEITLCAQISETHVNDPR